MELQEPAIGSEDITNPSQSSEPPITEPSVEQVYRFLVFGLSLPERTLRSTAAMVSGAISESASLLVPQAFQDSKTYSTFVKQMLDVVAKDVGGVKIDNDPSAASNTEKQGEKPDGTEPEVEDYVAKKAVSTFVDFAGMAALHVSPMTVLAIVSDIAYGSQTYLNELADELKREGVIDEESTIANTAELLEAIGKASSETADSLDLPPLCIKGLQETIQRTRDAVTEIDPTLLIPQSEIESLWHDMATIATEEDVNLFSVSSAITMYTLDQLENVTTGALATARVTGSLLDRHLIDHYRQGIAEIYEKGLFEMVAESSEPYLDAVWYNFSSTRPTITEDVVSGKIFTKAWDAVNDWFGDS